MHDQIVTVIAPHALYAAAVTSVRGIPSAVIKTPEEYAFRYADLPRAGAYRWTAKREAIVLLYSERILEGALTDVERGARLTSHIESSLLEPTEIDELVGYTRSPNGRVTFSPDLVSVVEELHARFENDWSGAHAGDRERS